MKFLRSIFTNSFIGLICTLLAVFGVWMGVITFMEGRRPVAEAIAYVAAGIAVFILGRKIAGRDESTQNTGASGKKR